jgi:hypothetical protein
MGILEKIHSPHRRMTSSHMNVEGRKPSAIFGIAAVATSFQAL